MIAINSIGVGVGRRGVSLWARCLAVAWIAGVLSATVLASTPSHDGPRLAGLAYVASSPDTVYAAGEGIFKSSDGGISWASVTTGLSGSSGYQAILTDPHDSERVIALPEFHPGLSFHYLESVNAGRSWVEKTVPGHPGRAARIGGFAMHPVRPGIWVVLLDGRIWSTADGGARWQAAMSLDAPLGRGAIVATQEAFYAASTSQVWRSDDGVSWLSTGFPGAVGTMHFSALGPNRIAAKSDDRHWWVLADSGAWERVPMLSPYENRERTREHCRPQHSPADPRYLVATCTDKNKYPNISIDYSAQLHSFDAGETWSLIGGKGLPGAWFPYAIAMHPRDPAKLLMSWVSGRIFRSDDHGATWQASDEGLRIPSALVSVSMPYAYIYLRETPLNQAVMAHDMEAVRRLAAEGVDFSERGPAGMTPLEWSLMLGAFIGARGDSMYQQLRESGAKAQIPNVHVMEFVLRFRFRDWSRVFEDMVRSGLLASPGWREVGLGSPLSLAPADRPLGDWVDLHLSQATPGQSAQLTLDLAVVGELALAERVAAFDAGKYSNSKEVLRLLKELPANARALRYRLVVGYRGHYDRIAPSDALYGLLADSPGGAEWVLEVLPSDRRPISPDSAVLLMQALLGELDRPDWGRALVLGKRGPRIGKQGWRAISDALVLGCAPGMLAAAVRAGVPIKASLGGSFQQSSVRAALWACRGKEASVRKAHLDGLHRMGLRLAKDEVWILDEEEVTELRDSSLWPHYQGSVGNVAGVGVNLEEVLPEVPPRVTETIAGFPASRVDIRLGDSLVAVNGVGISGKSQDEIARLLRGRPGTKVALTMERNGTERSIVQLRRQPLFTRPQSDSVQK